jgi:acyl-[acyl-carrier-protein]-phospholipid O-acyltransferase/long-chain-fatty-acid--[acyl-carrier-protein] ligase
MIQALMIALALAAAYLAVAAWLKVSRKLSFHQALLYTPLKLLYRIDDRAIAQAQRAPAPAIYVITHQSRLDPALMLSLLPADTLHILDADSAASARLEPWRAAGRSIAFNAEHLFVSRRLVRHLRGRGRLAVYLPEIEEPMPRGQQSLYRAVARIAGRGDANVVAIHVHGYRKEEPKVIRADAAHFGLLPRLTISALPPVKLADLSPKAQDGPTPSNALSQRSREAAELKKAA